VPICQLGRVLDKTEGRQRCIRIVGIPEVDETRPVCYVVTDQHSDTTQRIVCLHCVLQCSIRARLPRSMTNVYYSSFLALHHGLTTQHRRCSRLHLGDWKRWRRCRNMEECFSNECFVCVCVCAVCLVGCIVQLQHTVIMC